MPWRLVVLLLGGRCKDVGALLQLMPIMVMAASGGSKVEDPKIFDVLLNS